MEQQERLFNKSYAIAHAFCKNNLLWYMLFAKTKSKANRKTKKHKNIGTQKSKHICPADLQEGEKHELQL